MPVITSYSIHYTKLYDPHASALNGLMDGGDDAFDLEILTPHARIVDTVEIQGQRDQSLGLEMRIDLKAPIPLDQRAFTAIANQIEIFHLLGPGLGQVGP